MLKHFRRIPRQLTLSEFNEFIFGHLPKPKRGPPCKITFFKIFNYILTLLYTGCQWISLPISIDPQTGKPEIHYTRIFKIFKCWVKKGVFERFLNILLCGYMIEIYWISQFYTAMER